MNSNNILTRWRLFHSTLRVGRVSIGGVAAAAAGIVDSCLTQSLLKQLCAARRPRASIPINDAPNEFPPKKTQASIQIRVKKSILRHAWRKRSEFGFRRKPGLVWQSLPSRCHRDGTKWSRTALTLYAINLIKGDLTRFSHWVCATGVMA